MENYNTFKQEGNILIHTRLLDAPRDLVWEVWTNPAHIKEWWGPNGFSLTTKSMTVEPGKIWDFIMHGMGRDWDNKIEYVEVKKPSLLSYKHSGAENEDYNFIVSVSFEEAEGKTLLTMKSVFKSKEIIDELNRKVNAIEGGKQTLNRLGEYLNILINE
ncbi:ATPase [Chitinophaga sp. SYP-B3965]|uniref:SRPBCC domain-containing protein n=1 Tax=Chitinophaga sp. SYP-B3965 TaxID=2663120 RepID=UPI0012999217|nr:SRPBCC domain-containing protein [Chitinophaga sp. SYP-B3965]MRG47315.1 ATPase [Chitinophaga sp. SYP-B3965]